MSVLERKARHREVVRQQIIEAAGALFARHGIESVSMRRIAREIDYSPTAIYLYFEDKSDLFRSVCEQTFIQLEDQNTEIRERIQDPLEALIEGSRNYIDFGLEHPNHYRVTFMTPFPVESGESWFFQSGAAQQAFSTLADGIAACVQAGRFRPLDVHLTASYWWAACHGVTSLLITDCGFPWPERETLVSSMIDNLVAGLLPEAEMERGAT